MNIPLEFDLEEITFALADAVDLVGIDRIHHGKRVAYIATEIGRHLGWGEEKLHDLATAGVLHDFGLSSTREFQSIARHFSPKGWQQHSERGWLLISSFYPIAHLAPLVLHHHTPWMTLGDGHLADTDTALLANCIFIADRIEILISQEADTVILTWVEQTRERIQKYRGTLFAPQLVDTFVDISRHEAFWLYLDQKYLDHRLRRWIRKERKPLDLPQVRQLAKLFARVVDSKSPFTAAHSHQVGLLGKWLGEHMKLPEKQTRLIEISGYLHDIGKLRVADEILDKPAGLTRNELAVIRRHTFDTYQILNSIKGFWGISEWAAFHHETLIGNGYPFGVSEPLLCTEARIIAVADVFQALCQHRPYRPSLPPAAALKILTQFARDKKLDVEIVDLIRENLDEAVHLASGGGEPVAGMDGNRMTEEKQCV